MSRAYKFVALIEPGHHSYWAVHDNMNGNSPPTALLARTHAPQSCTATSSPTKSSR